MDKIYCIALSILLGTTSVSAQENLEAECDTILNITGADVVVSQDDAGLTVDIKDSDDQIQHTYNYPYTEGETYVVERSYHSPATLLKHHNISMAFSGFSVGFVKALDAPAGLGQEMGKSLEFSLDQIMSLQWTLPGGRNMFAVGVGVDWRNYKVTGDQRFMINEGIVSICNYEDEQNPLDSRLQTFTLQFPISYVHSFNRYIKAGLSVILDANLYGSLKSHYTDTEGAKHETFQKCTSAIRKFSVDFKATIQFCPMVALYCKYSPMKVFKTGFGPEITPLSAGFTFFY